MRLFLRFDENVDSSMRAAAAKIASESAFKPVGEPFHVCILGSLHSYTRDEIVAATQSFPTELRGRFVKWELVKSQLRAAVEIEGIIETVQSMHKQLPRARPWSTYYVTIGGAENIDRARHDEFLAAVQAAFPLDPEMLFILGRIDLHDEPRPQQVTTTKTSAPRKPKSSTLNPKAPAFQTTAGDVKKQRKRKARSSPHMKWQRATETGSSVDDLIKTANTGRRSAAHAVSRAAKVQAARQVWVAPRE